MKPSILIAEDDTASRTALARLLDRWGYEVEAVRDGIQAWEALQRPDAPRLAILDWLMPGLDGLEVCRRLRFAGGDRYTYVILLTARDRKADIVAGLEGGADDYITKPFDRQELAARLAVGQRILTLEEQLVAAREQLSVEATLDPLTQLWNRRAAERALRRDLARSARNGEPLAIALIDVDGFKAINDRHGHAAGDAVLMEGARRLRAALRAGDTVARWGGDELLAVLPDTQEAIAVEVAERLRLTLREPEIAVGGVPVAVTASLGVAVASPESWCDLEELLARADEALYCAKEGGRDQVVLHGARPSSPCRRSRRGLAAVG